MTFAPRPYSYPDGKAATDYLVIGYRKPDIARKEKNATDMGKVIKIWAKLPGKRAEELTKAVDQAEADYFVKEYALLYYGQGYKIWSGRREDEPRSWG